MPPQPNRNVALSNIPQLGSVPQRIPVDVELVHRLVTNQFPQWADLPIQPVTHGGWDNWTFHLGSTMLARFPSAAEYALAVEKEHRWLPKLAPQLPLPISTPLAKGEPDTCYPFSWSIYRWINGEPASFSRIANQVVFAVEVAEFLTALQGVDTAGGPPPGKHNWFRGGTLRTFDEKAQQALATLKGHVDVTLAQEIWAVALDAPWDGISNWFHGDVAPGNLLLIDGQLAAVIDFGTCGVGDPSCDFAVAWTLLAANSRQVFRERLAIGEAAWARGRGWALWKTLVTCAQGLGKTDEESTNARRILNEIFAEYKIAHRSTAEAATGI